MNFCKNHQALCARFGLLTGQVHYPLVYKNLWWELDGDVFGYGDISPDNVATIQSLLDDSEVFLGWNEHHKTSWQQTDVPMLRITKDEFTKHPELKEEKYGR